MRQKRRTHLPDFKAKVALVACQENLTKAELIKMHDAHMQSDHRLEDAVA